MLFADKLGMPKKIKDLAESLDLEVTNHHDPEFDAKLCALIFGELTDKYPSYQELILYFAILSSGETGIRPPGTSQYNGFQDRRNRPLCHLSQTSFQKCFC